MKKRVVDVLMSTAVEMGIENCFAVVGGGAMHIDNALSLCDEIDTVFNHHEQACTMAAEAYARYSGKIAMASVTSGPGATNALTGVMGAWEDSIPMLVISGNTRYGISVASTGLPLRYRGVQEFDIINSIGNMTKYSKVLKNPDLVKYEVQKAITIAMDGRRGPVWLDIPLDIQNSIIDDKKIPLFKNNKKTVINEGEINECINLLKNAARPVLIVGSGIISSDNMDNLEEFRRKIELPTLGAAWVADVGYNEDPMFFGLSGNIGPRSGNFILQNADVILTLGTSLSYNETGYKVDAFAPNAKIIMIDADENEYLKHEDKVDLFINSGLKDFFDCFKITGFSVKANPEWIEFCRKLNDRFDKYEAIKNIDLNARVNKYYFWKKYDEIAPEDEILALGNSSCNSAKLQVGKRYKKQRVITNYMCGSMGYDLPAAIGCAVASKKSVLCVTGDGSIMMNLQELQTIISNELPVKIIVFENDGYNAIKQTCKNFFNGKEFGCSKETGVSMPKFEGVAAAFEYEYDCCETNGQLEEKLKWLFKESKNVILEIKEQFDDPLIPKVMSRIGEDGQMKSPALHDMYPFIDESELNELLIWGKNKL